MDDIVSFTHSGSTDNLDRFLKSMKTRAMYDAIDFYAQEGVNALQEATPVFSGLAASSWYYEINKTAGNTITIGWFNDDVDTDGVPIVILLQFGHGTGTGGYVQGYDFINPATQHVFDKISDNVWKAVQSA